MNRIHLSVLLCTVSLCGTQVAFSQKDTSTKSTSQKDTSTTVPDTTLLGLPGDNLDLYVVMELFQKSKTIEEFEKNLNTAEPRINNLDLDLDEKVDFIKVTTTKKDDDFTFVLSVPVTKEETQDVAVILVSKDKNKKVTMQIVGDKELYGKNYIVEINETKSPSVTPNPGYTGSEPPPAPAPATTTTVVVEQVPIVQYVYSPAYVPYVPPYYYGFYPPYFFPPPVVAIGIYAGFHYAAHYHGGYGYHGNAVVVHNHNSYNNYNNNHRNTSDRVSHNNRDGSYNRGTNSSRPSAGTRPSTGAGGSRPSAGQQPAGGTRPSAGQQPSGGSRPSAGQQPSSGGSRPS